MTRWTHEEVRDLYKRAENAEEKLLFLARAVLEGRMTEQQAKDALHFLVGYRNPSRKAALSALGLKDDTPAEGDA